MSWQREVDEINQRRKWADELGGADRIARHRDRGLLTVRERIDGVADPGSFREVGKLAGSGVYKDGAVTNVKPALYVMGIAKVDGRPVAIGGGTAPNMVPKSCSFDTKIRHIPAAGELGRYRA